jgi:hypothetical protein
MADLYSRILAELRRCEDQSLALDDFRAWFVPLSLDVEQSDQPEAIQLAHHIDGVLAEASSADWNEDDLRQELANIAHSWAEPYGENRYGSPGAFAESYASFGFTHAGA